MNQTAHDTNARGQRAVEAHARAETDAVFDAAAPLFDAAPERARPSSWRAEMDTAPPTTSKLTFSVEAAAIVDCSCPRAAACIAAARAAAARSSRLTAPSTASSDAGHRLSGGATSQHLARPCHQSLVFAILSPLREVLLAPQGAFDRATGPSPDSPISSLRHLPSHIRHCHWASDPHFGAK